MYRLIDLSDLDEDDIARVLAMKGTELRDGDVALINNALICAADECDRAYRDHEMPEVVRRAMGESRSSYRGVLRKLDPNDD